MSKFLHGLLHVAIIGAQIAIQLVLAHYGVGVLSQVTAAGVLSSAQMKLAMMNHNSLP